MLIFKLTIKKFPLFSVVKILHFFQVSRLVSSLFLPPEGCSNHKNKVETGRISRVPQGEAQNFFLMAIKKPKMIFLRKPPKKEFCTDNRFLKCPR